MAKDDHSWDAAVAGQQRRDATAARRRSDALRDALDRRMRSAEEHQAETDALLHRGIHGDEASC